MRHADDYIVDSTIIALYVITNTSLLKYNQLILQQFNLHLFDHLGRQ